MLHHNKASSAEEKDKEGGGDSFDAAEEYLRMLLSFDEEVRGLEKRHNFFHPIALMAKLPKGGVLPVDTAAAAPGTSSSCLGGLDHLLGEAAEAEELFELLMRRCGNKSRQTTGEVLEEGEQQNVMQKLFEGFC
uniref:Uncharacterized protein n=1 Tax=Heterosigma akashiwo TaxID=2829 RepID=A0A7S3UTX2_HETAK